ncbi:helix-turn-helix transcriptional regulator [Algoriphagus sediminis]|uniref:WYL domain-containing protein n=1 Tax=Algoriphagus sediminis TaxID=3057113 RepID=A0ABT7YDF5_9BACT|nr:WYL domain-containing protein [Algoriphagus sediminis]MDN3204562.1 WYL domain-containing protein [Algoriphagus sediminis]
MASKIEQQKILRVFKLINLLQSNVGKPVHRLAEYLQTDERTIYRYFKLLEALGFEVVKEFSKYKLLSSPSILPGSQFGGLSKDESEWLAQQLKHAPKGSLYRDSVMKKLQSRSEINQGSQELFKAHLTKMIDEISSAMQEKRQIWLKDYYSLSSESTKDRLVEPVAFTNDYSGIHAFEVESQSMKIFKIERVGELLVSQNPMEHEDKHKMPGTSLFGFSGQSRFHVKLKMSKKAYQLMQEEHPNARPYMYIKNRNHYYFNGEVPQLPGVGRFVMGLPGEVTIEEGEELRAYVKSQLEKIDL